MCGIFGIIAPSGRAPSLDDAAVTRLRDTMTHRGPDDAGLWRHQNAVLAHRRLSVLDISSGGHQPMHAAGGRCTLVYNGELYNDADLRATLPGVRFRSTSDTETIVELLALRGPRGIDELRGMYALGMWDADQRTLILARDPLGIKPLYYAIVRTPVGPELVFASEPRAILAHPHVTPRPDAVVAAAYLTTIRTTLADRTLFEGIRCLRPGEVLEFSADRELEVRTLRPAGWMPPAPPEHPVRDAVEASIRLHLRSDVPICCLLSGGLDSSIVASVAQRALGGLHTFCSGAESSAAEARPADADDFAFAARVAGALGTYHTRAPVSRELFVERWPAMIAAMGLPLSTPNEVAINQVARTLRAAGKVVTLSGEGADELFAGYQLPMELAFAHEQSMPADVRRDPAARARSRAEFQFTSNAWMNPAAADHVLAPGPLAAIEGHSLLRRTYEQIASECERESPDEPLQAHLSFHRRVNLVGLLQRLDTATMLASVEGRTPLADAPLASLATALPMRDKFRAGGSPSDTKIALRAAFASDLPPEIVCRPKASFPLPFQQWMGPLTPVLSASGFARDFFTPVARQTIIRAPEQHWAVAWPMINLALWGQVWWG
jgi:asparagine synthase (glutamine-hydrolysing)